MVQRHRLLARDVECSITARHTTGMQAWLISVDDSPAYHQKNKLN